MARRRSHKQFRLHALRLYPFCQWCQGPLTWQTATTDHILPLSRGGSNRWENLCLACQECNTKRKNHLPTTLPSGPVWSSPEPESVKSPKEPCRLAAWTRYPGARWRSTFQGSCPEKILRKVERLFGKTAEVVILLIGQEPGEGSCTEERRLA